MQKHQLRVFLPERRLQPSPAAQNRTAEKGVQTPEWMRRNLIARRSAERALHPVYATVAPMMTASSVAPYRKFKHVTIKNSATRPFPEFLLQEFEQRLSIIGCSKSPEASTSSLRALFSTSLFQEIIPNILYLDLHGQYIDDNGLGIIADHCPHIHCLWLARNLITTQGIFDHLNKFTGLHKLGLEYNFGHEREGIDAKGYQLILEYVRRHPSVTEVAVRVPVSFDKELHEQFMHLPEETKGRVKLV